MENAFTVGMLLAVPVLAVQMWLIGRAVEVASVDDGP
jgi:hypothetical protein